MSVWKKASTLFSGGTEQIRSFTGKRVKVKTNLLSVPVYDGIGHSLKTANLKVGAIGFISNPHPQSLDEILIAFPDTPNKIFRDLNSLTMGGNFFVVQINWPTFKQQFDIES